MELWTVAMTTGLPAAERLLAHTTKSFQSRREEPLMTTSPEPPVLTDWMIWAGLPKEIWSSAGTDPRYAPSRAFWPMVVIMPPPDCPMTRLTCAAGVPFTKRVQWTGRDRFGSSGTRQNPYRSQKYCESLTMT